MALKKSHEVDAWLARPRSDIAVVLVYGPDRGLVAERGRRFADGTGLSLDDPFSVVRLDGAEVDRDQGRLLDEARTIPMFVDRRLLWVRNASGLKALTDDVKELCAQPPRDAVILIEAGDLKKGAPLRTLVEGSPAGMALPCYADEARDIDAVIDQELERAGMSISLEARHALRRNLGGDRLATRGELEKLVLYAHGRRQIELEDISAMTGDVAGHSFDDAVDAVLGGKVEALDAAFGPLSSNAGQAGQLLAAAARQFQQLESLRAKAGPGGRGAAAAVAGARPPVFFARRSLVQSSVERWDEASIRKALVRLHAAILETRRRQDLATAVARQTLLGLALEAGRLARR
jgi:DNA polymerase-3 subunit delta